VPQDLGKAVGQDLHNLFFDHYREAKRRLSVEENKVDEGWDYRENISTIK